MPERPDLKLAELPHQVRQQVQSLPQRWREFREAFQEDPAALWHSPVTRIAGWITLGVVALVVGYVVIGSIVPSGADGNFAEATQTATLFVACSDPDCAASFTTKQEMDFDDWPITCPDCGQETVYRAQRCQVCRNWYSVAPGGVDACPHCARQQAAEPAPARQPERSTPTYSDDAEDPW